MQTIELPVALSYLRQDDMTDEEFFQFCAANSHLRFERNSDKTIVIMPPVSSESSFIHSDILGYLWVWNYSYQKGKISDSSGGYTLSNKAVRAPDAAWISNQRLERIITSDFKGFIHACPDFVVEVRSPSDSLPQLKEKMEEWRNNGCLLGWLIDPVENQVFIYRTDGSVERVEGLKSELSGENVLPGFILDLSKIFKS